MDKVLYRVTGIVIARGDFRQSFEKYTHAETSAKASSNVLYHLKKQFNKSALIRDVDVTIIKPVDMKNSVLSCNSSMNLRPQQVSLF